MYIRYCVSSYCFFFFKQKTAYEIMPSLVGSEMCIRDRLYTQDNSRPTDHESIVITQGEHGGLIQLVDSMCDPGDNILLPDIHYSTWSDICKMHGVETRRYCHDLSNIKDIEGLVDSRTKFLLLANPHPIMGKVYSKEELETVLSVSEKLKLAVVSEESCYQMTFTQQPYTSFSIFKGKIPFIIITGLSKTYLFSGLKFGAVMFFDKDEILADILNGVKNLVQLWLHPASFVQYALPNIVKNIPHPTVQSEVMKTMEERYALVKQGLAVCKQIIVSPCQGAFNLTFKLADNCNETSVDDFVNNLQKSQAIKITRYLDANGNAIFSVFLGNDVSLLEDFVMRIQHFFNVQQMVCIYQEASLDVIP
eukprot:TRINITY_DN7770_c0_g1_i7.p1 TRINITY_DN7770_c0_g1~~TRINITY_DN7770_c0_g1_i7.p1  ORF type:complete len:364 (+),score=31.31 TRINITY_DN7770_c0_g1_i7:2-1093(+)